MSTDRVTAWIQDRRELASLAEPGRWWSLDYSHIAKATGVNAHQGGEDDAAVAEEVSIPDAIAIVDAHSEFPKALTALEKVLEPHKPLGSASRDGETVWDECEECYGGGWPCDTYTVIESALEAGE